MADNTLKCSCEKEIKKQFEKVENESYALTLLKEYNKSNKRFFIILITILLMWGFTIFGFVWYLNQYDFCSYTITQDGEGINNINQSGKVDIINESNFESEKTN